MTITGINSTHQNERLIVEELVVEGVLTFPGSVTVTATGGTTARTLADIAATRGLSVYDFGYVDGNDIAVAINAAIAAGRSSGVRYPIFLPKSGTHAIRTTIVPRSYYPLVGAGEHLTRLSVETDAPYQQTAGHALSSAGITGVSFIAAAGHEDAVVIKLTAAFRCRFERLRFEGFTTGKILVTAGALITAPDETVFPATTSNIVYNTFRDWWVLGCATGLELFGSYGSTPTPSPPSSANSPNVVLSKNVYDNITLWNVTGTGIDIIGACDHEVWGHISINFNADNAVGVKIGSDPVFTGNNYVNNHEFPEIVFSTNGAFTGLVGISVPGWSFGNAGDIKDDITTGFTAISVTANSQSHNFQYREIVTNGKTRVVTETKEWVDQSPTWYLNNPVTPPSIGTEREDAHGNAVEVGNVVMRGRDSAATAQAYAQLTGYCISNASGAEVGQLRLGTVFTGVMQDHLWCYNGAIGIRDGSTGPVASPGVAWIFVDTADGDLKVRFSDGVI